MKFCKLRIAWSVGWGVLAVLLCMLWVWSYTWCDFKTVFGRNFSSLRGRAYIDKDVRVILQGSSDSELQATINSAYAIMSFPQETATPLGNGLGAPHWVLLTIAAVAAVAPWTRLRFHFSLRTLLIVTTLVAVALGIIVWMSRVG